MQLSPNARMIPSTPSKRISAGTLDWPTEEKFQASVTDQDRYCCAIREGIPKRTRANSISLAFSLYLRQYEHMAITRRQREVYDFISRFVTENGYSPSFEEIGQGLKLNSLATVHKHISNLNS